MNFPICLRTPTCLLVGQLTVLLIFLGLNAETLLYNEGSELSEGETLSSENTVSLLTDVSDDEKDQSALDIDSSQNIEEGIYL